MRGIDIAIVVAVIAFVVALVFAFVPIGGVDRAPSLQPVPSQVAIDTVINVDLSTNLADGIDFGLVDPPVTDQPADNNDDNAGATTLWVVRHPDTTVDVEVCLSSDGDLTSGINTIPLAGETYIWDSADDTTFSGQGAGDSVSLIQSPPGASVLASDTMTGAVDDFTYYRFWLDVANAGQPAGTYTNVVDFSVVQAGTGCPTLP